MWPTVLFGNSVLIFHVKSQLEILWYDQDYTHFVRSIACDECLRETELNSFLPILGMVPLRIVETLFTHACISVFFIWCIKIKKEIYFFKNWMKKTAWRKCCVDLEALIYSLSIIELKIIWFVSRMILLSLDVICWITRFEHPSNQIIRSKKKPSRRILLASC